MEFVKCGCADRQAAEDLYAAVVADLMADTNYPQWSQDYPGGAVPEALAAGALFAAVEAGQILGAVMLDRDVDGAYRSGQWSQALGTDEYLTVHALAVSPPARGRSVGSFLLEGCLQEAARQGCRAVRLDIVPENLPARRLYLRHGFTPAGLAALPRDLPQVPLWELFEYNLPAQKGECG